MKRLNLELSDEADETLEMLRMRMGKTSKAEVLHSAVALLKLAQWQKARGKNLVLIDEDGQVDTRIEIT